MRKNVINILYLIIFFGTAQFSSLNRKDSYDRDKLKAAVEYLFFNSYVNLNLMSLNKSKVFLWVAMLAH